MNESEEVIQFFHRHIVPIYLYLKKDSNKYITTITTFVLSVFDNWYLLTAGHCLKKIDELLNEGYQFETCLLYDSLGLSAKYDHPIRFIYEKSEVCYFCDGFDYDYGLIPLTKYYRELLEANKIVSLNEEVWKKQPQKVDFYTLIGIPTELVTIGSDFIEFVPQILRVDPLPEKPNGFSDVNSPMFYGKIELGSNLSSIEGMSGGPIFGFSEDSDGQLRYWLVALQSRWLPDSHYIAACKTNFFGDYLENQFKK